MYGNNAETIKINIITKIKVTIVGLYILKIKASTSSIYSYSKSFD